MSLLEAGEEEEKKINDAPPIERSETGLIGIFGGGPEGEEEEGVIDPEKHRNTR